MTDFRSAGVISSPLTRALQTALVSLNGHEGLQSNGIEVLSLVREVKTAVGLDTVGVVHGDDALVRAKEKMLECVDDAGKVDSYCGVKITPLDTHTDWWTRLGDKDTKVDIGDRLRDLLTIILFSPRSHTILTGHSLFFRELCKRHLSAEFKRTHAAFAKELAKKKMNNGACMRVDLVYRNGAPLIENAKFLFGTGFGSH